MDGGDGHDLGLGESESEGEGRGCVGKGGRGKVLTRGHDGRRERRSRVNSIRVVE